MILQITQAVGAPTQGVLVCGDSGNDVELFQVRPACCFKGDRRTDEHATRCRCQT